MGGSSIPSSSRGGGQDPGLDEGADEDAFHPPRAPTLEDYILAGSRKSSSRRRGSAGLHGCRGSGPVSGPRIRDDLDLDPSPYLIGDALATARQTLHVGSGDDGVCPPRNLELGDPNAFPPLQLVPHGIGEAGGGTDGIPRGFDGETADFSGCNTIPAADFDGADQVFVGMSERTVPAGSVATALHADPGHQRDFLGTSLEAQSRGAVGNAWGKSSSYNLSAADLSSRSLSRT